MKRLACGLWVCLPLVLWTQTSWRLSSWRTGSCGESVWIRGAYRILYCFARIFRLGPVFLAWTAAISNWRVHGFVGWGDVWMAKWHWNSSSEKYTFNCSNDYASAWACSGGTGWPQGYNRQSDPRRKASYLVDPASSYMLVSKIKPCMSKYKRTYIVKLQMAH